MGSDFLFDTLADSASWILMAPGGKLYLPDSPRSWSCRFLSCRLEELGPLVTRSDKLISHLRGNGMTFHTGGLKRWSPRQWTGVQAAATGRFLSDRRGATTVEYALMLAIIVGGMLAFTRITDSVATAAYDAQLVRAPSGCGYGWLLAELVTIGVIGTLLVFVRRSRNGFFETQGGLFSFGDKSRAELEMAKQRLFSKRQAILRAVTADSAALFRSRLEIRHLMTPTVTRVFPETTAKKVELLMRTERLRHVMVCDASEKLVGVISDRDLRKANARTAAELMTSNPITVSPDDLIGPAITGLMNRNISCLPVLDEGRLCGVLTTTDLMMALQCCLQVLQAAAAVEAEPSTDSASENRQSELAEV